MSSLISVVVLCNIGTRVQRPKQVFDCSHFDAQLQRGKMGIGVGPLGGESHKNHSLFSDPEMATVRLQRLSYHSTPFLVRRVCPTTLDSLSLCSANAVL